MPISSYAVVPKILDEMCRVKPKSVLDVGVGFGFWGAAIRQWSDHGVCFQGSSYPTRLVGIEGFPAYRSYCWSLYNHIFEGKIQDFDWNKEKFDFIIVADVIEHLSYIEGKQLIHDALNSLNLNGAMVISTPGIFCEQGAAYGNELEIHRSLWT